MPFCVDVLMVKAARLGLGCRSEWSDISEGFMTGACRRDGKLDGLMSDEGALDHPLDRDH